jgi:hypothetical protein
VPCICCRGPRCRALGHANSRKAGRRAPAGLYVALVSSEGQVLGGVPGARLTEADLLEARRLAQVRDEELVRAALALQNESVTFEDAVYETPTEFGSLPFAQAQGLDLSPVQETSKPAALPSGARAPDSATVSDTAAMMAAMTEQMRQMSANNKALTDLLAAQANTNSAASTQGGLRASMRLGRRLLNRWNIFRTLFGELSRRTPVLSPTCRPIPKGRRRGIWEQLLSFLRSLSARPLS